jgi:hypothetical protein
VTTEISTQAQPRGLALRTMADALAFADMVAQSDFAPKDFKGKPQSCLLAIQHGSEVGLSPMQSLQSIAVINGRPTIWGDAALALVQSSPVCEYVVEHLEGEGDSLTAVCEAKRRGYPQATVVRFSMADAKRAGLAGKGGPWTQYPARMLQLRARGFALRNAFADALRGLITAEEAQDYPAAVHSAPTAPAGTSPAIPPAALREAPAGQFKAEPTLPEVIRERIAAARNTGLLGRIGDRIDVKESEGALTAEEADELRGLVDRRHDEIEPQTQEAK